jgi:hypothetical protein
MDLIEKLDAFLASPGEYLRNMPKVQHPPPVMPSFRRRREHFTQLRDRHLIWVEELGSSKEPYDREYWRDYFMSNWNRLFPLLRRRKVDEVPSDQFRKSCMISELLDLVEMRRAELADRRYMRHCLTPKGHALVRQVAGAVQNRRAVVVAA